MLTPPRSVSLRALVPHATFALTLAAAACSAGKTNDTNNGAPTDASAGDGAIHTDGGFAADLGVDEGADTYTYAPPTPQTVITAGTPSDAPTKFGGTASSDAGNAPSIVYPADGALIPPNMGTLEFHFLPGTGNTLFEIAFESPNIDLKVYTTCTPVGAGCVFSPDAAAWSKLTSATRGASMITWTVRGSDGTAGGAVGASASQKIGFAAEDIKGGLYYWNAGAGATMRYEFGVSGKNGEMYLNAMTAGVPTCIGCHELSRKGDKIVEGYSIPMPTGFNVYDVATRTPTIQKQGTGNFFAWAPDGTKLLASTGSTMVLLDGTSGAALPGGANQATMPTWSPDGSTIVYVRETAGQIPVGSPGVSQGQLMTLSWNGSTLLTGKTLVPYAGQNNYYPAFAPDSQLVAFNRSSQNSYDAPDAQVWVVKADGSGAPLQLSNASPSGGRGDSWPKWTPTVQQYQGHPLFWITFSSRRAYGLRLNTAAPTSSTPGTAQIWMAAVDPTLVAQGKDPSFPAFWLPFQDTGSGNHIAQWVLTVARKPCKTAADCNGGETCANSLCVPAIQ